MNLYDLDLHTSFKVTAHPLINGTLWLKYEIDWTKGRKGMLRTRIFSLAMTFAFDLETWSEKFEALIRPIDLKIELVYTVKDGKFFFNFRQNSIQQIGSLLSIMLSIIKPTCQRVVKLYLLINHISWISHNTNLHGWQNPVNSFIINNSLHVHGNKNLICQDIKHVRKPIK